MSDPTAIDTLEQFFAHALAIEEEAATRYHELAQQMEAHHNPGAAQLFSQLANAELDHATMLRLLARDLVTVPLAPWEYHWNEAESPEAIPYDAAHYRMTPFHALSLALENERRARRFFETVAAQTKNPQIERFAREFAEEEKLHEEHLAAILERTPPPPADWSADHDPPVETG